MLKLLDKVHIEKLRLEEDKFNLLVNSFNEKPDENLKSKILETGGKIVELNNIQGFISQKMGEIEEIKEKIKLLKMFKINSHPPSHENSLLQSINSNNSEMTGGDYNGSILAPSWVNECNSKIPSLLSEEKKNIINSYVKRITPKKLIPDDPKTKVVVAKTFDFDFDLSNITIDQFIELKQNRFYDIEIEYSEDLVKKKISNELFKIILQNYYDGDRDNIIREYGKLEFWNTQDVVTMDNAFINRKLDENLHLWNMKSLENTDCMFQKTIFNTDIAFDFRSKRIFVNNIPADKIKNLKINRDLKEDTKNGKYYFISWDVSKLRSAYGMFNNSTFNGLLGNWNPTNLENVSYMFSSCEFFNQPIYFGKSKIKNMEHMFSYSNFNNYVNFKELYNTVENMDRMFYSTYVFNKPIVHDNHLLFFKYNNINMKIKKLVSVEGMFYQASNFNQSFENINLKKKGINFNNFLNSANKFNKIESLQTMKIEKTDSTFQNSLELIEKPSYLDDISFNKIKLKPEIIFGIEQDLQTLISSLRKKEDKLKLITDIYNYEIGIIGVKFYLIPRSEGFTPFLFLNMKDTYSSSIFKEDFIFLNKKVDLANMELKSQKVKKYSLGENEVDIVQFSKDDGLILKYIFITLAGESTEPQYNSLVHNSCQYLYHINNYKYVESDILPKTKWKELLESNRYLYKISWAGSETPVDMIIRSNLVRSYKEAEDCMIFYLFARAKTINSKSITFEDIYMKNNNLKEYIDQFTDINTDYTRNFLKKFEYIVNVLNYKYSYSGYILGAYFKNITEKKPMPHIYRYDIENKSFTDEGPYRIEVNIYNKIKGINKIKYNETINSIKSFIANEKYIYEDIICNTTNTNKIEAFRRKSDNSSIDTKITLDPTISNEILEYIKDTKQAYLNKCSNFYWRGTKFTVDSTKDKKTQFKSIIDNLGKLHGTQFNYSNVINLLDLSEHDETIPSTNDCKTYRYYNASKDIGTAHFFSGSGNCCYIRYEIPVGMSGYFPSYYFESGNYDEKNIFDVYSTVSGEAEVIFHPFYKFEITNIKYAQFDATDDIYYINNSLFTDGNSNQNNRNKYIIHLRVTGYHDESSFSQKENWEQGDIIKLNFETLQKNYCIAPIDVAKLKISENELLFKILSIQNNKLYSFKKNYTCLFVKFNSTNNTYDHFFKDSDSKAKFRDYVLKNPNPTPEPAKELDFDIITIQQDDSCSIVKKNVGVFTLNIKSRVDININSDDFFTVTGLGLSTQLFEPYIIPKDVWILIPHWKGLEQNYEISSNINSSFESILYNLKGKDERFSSNVFSFNNGFKLYKDTQLPKDINFHISVDDLPCDQLIGKIDSRIDEKLSNCSSGICMIPLLNNNDGKIENVVKNNKVKYYFKVCDNYNSNLTDMINNVNDLKDPSYRTKIIFPLSSNSGANNITVIPIPHNNLSWEEIFKILLESEDHCIKPDHPIFQ